MTFPVRIIGAVATPGVYDITSANPGLNSAIAASQGYTPDANKKIVTIQRVTPRGNIATLYVNPMKDDIVLRPNDLIIVPEKSTTIAGRGFNFLSAVVMPFGIISNAANSWTQMFDPSRYYYH